MSRVKFPFEVVNSLDYFINREVGMRMTKYGKRVSKQAVMKDLADYCGCGIQNIERLRKNYSQTNIAIALKIAEYFNVNVEDIFKIR